MQGLRSKKGGQRERLFSWADSQGQVSESPTPPDMAGPCCSQGAALPLQCPKMVSGRRPAARRPRLLGWSLDSHLATTCKRKGAQPAQASPAAERVVARAPMARTSCQRRLVQNLQAGLSGDPRGRFRPPWLRPGAAQCPGEACGAVFLQMQRRALCMMRPAWRWRSSRLFLCQGRH